MIVFIESIQLQQRPSVESIVRFRGAILLRNNRHKVDHPLHTFIGRQICGRLPTRCLLPKETITRLELHCRILGHLSAVFCVAFDRTGEFVFTVSLSTR
jgi:hypothetical protein